MAVKNEWLLNNGDVTKGISYKVQNILKIPLEVKKGSSVTEKLIKDTLETPEAGKILQDMIEEYYYGKFYDGEVYLIKTDFGFSIARQKNIKKVGEKIEYQGEVYENFYVFENVNPYTQEVEPQYKEIENELKEKYYSQANNVKLLQDGLIIREVFSTDKPISETERERFLSKLRKRFAINPFKNVAGVNVGNNQDSGTSIFLGGANLKYDVQNANLGDIQNTTLAQKNRDMVFNYLGVPPQLMGSDSSSTYSNYETALLAFLENTIIPETKKIVSLLNLVLFDGERILEPNFEREMALIEAKEKNFNILLVLYNEGLINGNELVKNAGFEYIMREREEEEGGG